MDTNITALAQRLHNGQLSRPEFVAAVLTTHPTTSSTATHWGDHPDLTQTPDPDLDTELARLSHAGFIDPQLIAELTTCLTQLRQQRTNYGDPT